MLVNGPDAIYRAEINGSRSSPVSCGVNGRRDTLIYNGTNKDSSNDWTRIR